MQSFILIYILNFQISKSKEKNFEREEREFLQKASQKGRHVQSNSSLTVTSEQKTKIYSSEIKLIKSIIYILC